MLQREAQECETYFFGDGANDLKMLEAVNHGVIVKDCEAELDKLEGFVHLDEDLDRYLRRLIV